MSRFRIGAAAILCCAGLGSAPAEVFEIPAGDVTALQQALEAAAANDEPDVIELAPDGMYPIDAPQRFGGRVIINGNGAVFIGAAGRFAGIHVPADSSVTIRDLHFREIRARGVAALENSGTLRLVGATVSASFGEFCGRGICQVGWALASSGTLTMENTTFFGNGRSILNSGSLSISNSTIANDGDGLGLSGSGQVTAVNTIIAGHSDDCDIDQMESLGHNIDSDGSCGFDQPTDLPDTDARLGAFGDHGGPVPTVSVGAASPAIDAGDPEECALVDARGFVRANIPDWSCDIGAFERDGRRRDIGQALTATWFDVREDGHFFTVQVIGDGREQVLVHWNTFDAEGRPLWLQGVGGIRGHRVDLVLYRYGGMRYPDFDPSERTFEPWGTLTLAFPNCWRAVALYEPLDPALPPADSRLIRLINTAGLSCVLQ